MLGVNKTNDQSSTAVTHAVATQPAAGTLQQVSPSSWTGSMTQRLQLNETKDVTRTKKKRQLLIQKQTDCACHFIQV